MALYTLADLHLAADVAKPMDIFGGRWQGHTEKIIKNWRALVAPEDTIVLGGDISWGINLAEAKGDFALIDSLPGKKIILKGNHDLWWETASKMHRFLDENGFTTIDFLHNNCFSMKRPRCAAHAAGPLRRTSPTRTTRKSSSASCCGSKRR